MDDERSGAVQHLKRQPPDGPPREGLYHISAYECECLWPGVDGGTQPSQRLPLKSSEMEAGVKAVGYFFHRAVISAPLLPNLISCPIFKVARRKKRNAAGSLGVCQLRERVIIPSNWREFCSRGQISGGRLRKVF